MSGLFGGARTQATSPIRYNGIQVSSSSTGNCLPLAYGQIRLPFNLMWYGNFTSTPNKTNTGGKGGSGGQTTSYNYAASFVAGICEGPVTGILNVWNDKDLTTLTALGMTQFFGTSGQTAWSYLTSNFPAAAIPYDHICYIGAPNHSLGSSASLPNITFEVESLLSMTGTAATALANVSAGATSCTISGHPVSFGTWNVTFSDYEVRSCALSDNGLGNTTVSWSAALVNNSTNALILGIAHDAYPDAIIVDYLSDPNHGAGFPSSKIATLTGTNSYNSYCAAMGITLSPSETTQRAAADFIKEILQITNSEAVWSAGTIRITPYADTAVTGNGVTYTPNLTPQFIFTDDDYLDFPELDRVATADTYNHVRVEYLDRSNSYNTAIAEVSDIGDIAETGERVMTTLNFHEITNAATAGVVSTLVLQTSLYELNTLKFKVRPDYCLLEPMDYIGICDPINADGSGLGYGSVNNLGVETSSQVFRVKKVTLSDKNEVEIEAMEVPGAVRSAAIYNWQSVQGYNANFAVSAGDVSAPAFVEVYGTLAQQTGSAMQLYIAVGPPTANTAVWGGCDVYMSFDNATFDQIGVITSASRYGTLTANIATTSAFPDTTNTLSVALQNTNETLGTGSAGDAQALRILAAVDTGANLEILSYETANLVSAGNYGIQTMYRGVYGPTAKSHTTGAQFVRLDGNVFVLNIDPGWIGQTLYFKFCSYNLYGRAPEALSSATAYSHVMGGSLTAFGNAIVNESTLSVNGSCILYSPSTAAKQTTGSVAWDSSVYSSKSYTNGCTAECYPSQTTGAFMLGICLNPLTSSNYTNLAFAWYFETNGNCAIYESGTLVAGFGTYTTGDLFQIIYDGKHVTYYHNSTVVRTVNIAGQTYFMQLCFNSPGASAYGIEFNSSSVATQPFTLVALTNSVACSGTKAVSNVQDTASHWGYRNFTSNESFANGCAVSFSIVPGVDIQFLGMSTTPATGTVFANIFAAWYVNTTAVAVYAVFGGATIATVSHAPASSDVYTITYDTYAANFWLNGALIASQYAPGYGAMFLFGDMYSPSIGFQNISFEPFGQLSPNPFISTNACSCHDSTAYKSTTGSNGWDSAVYSINAYTTCHLQFKVSPISSMCMFGFCLTPTASNSYPNLAYAWYADGTNWEIYESGTHIGTYTAVASTDLASITYDGTTVTYYMNGQSIRTHTDASKSFYASSSFYKVGSSINSLSFGPGTVLDTVPTAGLDVGSATDVFNSFVAGPINVYTSGTTPTLIGTVAVPSYPYATNVVITVAGVVDHHFPSAQFSTYAAVTTATMSTATFTTANQIARNGSTSVPDAGGTFAFETNNSVAVNTPTTFYLYGYSGGSSVTGAYSNVYSINIKAEVIKR